MNRSWTVTRPQPAYIGWFLSCFIACTAAAVEPNRIWVDADGLFSVEARLIEIIDGRVVLLRQDGEKITIAVDKLSDRDTEYLDEVQQRLVKNDNPLRLDPPKRRELPPLPILDLPPAKHVAADGSSLSSNPPLQTELLSDPAQPLDADPAPFSLGVSKARIPIYRVDANDKCSRPIPIVTITSSGTRKTSIAMSVSGGVRILGEQRRNQLIRFDVDDRKAYVALDHDDTIRLIDHHVDSGRSLVLVGFNSLGKGGELAVATQWDRRVKLSHRRQLSIKKRGVSAPHLRWARWVDEEHFIAVIDQTLGLWNIVSGEQVYRIDGIDHRAEPAISAGRRYLAVPYNGAVHLFATTTGQSLGRIQTEKQVPGVIFAPQGDTLTIVTSRRLRNWDLPSATVSADVECRRSLGTDPPILIDSDLVLSSTGVLLSLFRGLPIWRYDIAATETVAIGKHVVMFRTHPVTELSIVSLPHDGAANAMHWLDNSPTEVDTQQWRVLGRSIWNLGSWTDHDVQISAAPDRLR